MSKIHRRSLPKNTISTRTTKSIFQAEVETIRRTFVERGPQQKGNNKTATINNKIKNISDTIQSRKYQKISKN